MRARSDAKRPSVFGQVSMELYIAIERVYFKAEPKIVFLHLMGAGTAGCFVRLSQLASNVGIAGVTRSLSATIRS